MFGLGPPQQIRAGRCGLAATRRYPQNPRSAITSIPDARRSTSRLARSISEVVYAPTSASKIAWVPHSASATSRACGNAACSPLFTPGRPNHSAFSAVSATSRHGPVDRHQPPPRQPCTRACRRRRAAQPPAGTAPPSARGPAAPGPGRSPTSTAAATTRDQPDAHDSPSVNNDSTSSYEPSECRPIPIAKYAITRAGNDRCRCSVRPAPAITSSTTSGGNTRVSTPTDTRSDNRRSDSGFTQPARGTPPNYTPVVLTERYWI